MTDKTVINAMTPRAMPKTEVMVIKEINWVLRFARV
jgi:hypothetical protein